MSDQFLDLELRVMILRHGRRRIIDALARFGDQTREDVERELIAAAERKSRQKQPKEQPIAELIVDACRERPEIAERVTTLVTRFENGTFLPHLREVVRFLDRAGVPHIKLKSRRASTPKLIGALAKLSSDELRQLAVPLPAEGESDFTILAREIMAGGRPRRPPKNER